MISIFSSLFHFSYWRCKFQ